MPSSYLKADFPLITESILLKFKRYHELLLKWSKIMNLTSILEEEEVYIKHFYDSMLLLNTTTFSDKTLCDVGSGAGFPGIILAIIEPTLHVTLLEPIQKRVTFLNEVIKDLELSNCQAFAIRAEDAVKTSRESFDLITSRAVAQLSILLELSIPLLKVGGYMLAMKSIQAKDELADSKNALFLLKAKVEKEYTFDLPNNHGKRVIIKIKKEGKTPSLYPRTFAQIKKKTL